MMKEGPNKKDSLCTIRVSTGCDDTDTISKKVKRCFGLYEGHRRLKIIIF